jgi:hypothetical protein
LTWADGSWTYNAENGIITWTLASVPVGDPYLYVSGQLTHLGNYVFSSSISSSTINISTETVTPLTINAAAEAKALSKTVGMQNTGIPIKGLVLAILIVFGGLAGAKRE